MQSKDSGTHTKAKNAKTGEEREAPKNKRPTHLRVRISPGDSVSSDLRSRDAIAGRVSLLVAQFYLNTFPNFCLSFGSHLNRFYLSFPFLRLSLSAAG